MMSVLDGVARVDPLSVLSGFRQDFYACLDTRGDALFELVDALLCTDGPVKTLVDLSLAPEHRRGHGALYGAVNLGIINLRRLRFGGTCAVAWAFSGHRRAVHRERARLWPLPSPCQ
jgi:hypothetical protein